MQRSHSGSVLTNGRHHTFMAIQVSLFHDEAKKASPQANGSNASFVKRVTSALFYALASFSITIINKNVLTVYEFPSVQCLGLGQMLTTIVVLYVAKMTGIITFPSLRGDTFHKLWPLPLIYMGNMVFGLGGTKQLSLPMFTALRRFLILMTMIAEYFLLKRRPSLGVQMSVYTMIVGALVAAYDDLGFNTIGYIYVFLNNFFSACNGVYIKKKLLVQGDEDKAPLGKYGLMFYNCLFMLVPTILVAHTTGELQMVTEYPNWHNGMFVGQFLLSCVMGFVLNYSVYLCSSYNSALAVSIIGCFKNVCITYVGMIIGADYIFSLVNFTGINISVAGSLMYLVFS